MFDTYQGPLRLKDDNACATLEDEVLTGATLIALADKIEAALLIDDDLAASAVDMIAAIDKENSVTFSASDMDSTDRILALIYHALPGWTLSIKGKTWQPNGHWTCSLRRSSGRDNDEYIGVGRGPTLPHSLLAALFRVFAHRI